MAKGSAGAAEELESLDERDLVEEYEGRLLKLADLLEDGSSEERVKAAYTVFRIVSQLNLHGGDGAKVKASAAGATGLESLDREQQLMIAQTAADLTSDLLVELKRDADGMIKTMERDMRSRVGGTEYDRAVDVRRNCDAAIGAMLALNDDQITELVRTNQLRAEVQEREKLGLPPLAPGGGVDAAAAAGAAGAEDKEADPGPAAGAPASGASAGTAASFVRKSGREADGRIPTVYELTQDEFGYEDGAVSDASSGGASAEGVEADIGIECCGVYCKLRTGICSGVCGRGRTVRSLVASVGKGLVLLLALPLLAGPVLVYLLVDTVAHWEEKGPGGYNGTIDLAVALTALYLCTHVAVFLLGSFNDVFKRNRHTRVRHAVIVLACLYTIVWGARLRMEGTDSESARTYFGASAVVMGVACALNAWLFCTSAGFIRGGPYKRERRIRTRCCGCLRLRKLYVLDLGTCLYKCKCCKILYRNNDEGLESLEADMSKTERILSKLLMQNQDVPKVQRQVKFYKKRLRKYKREVKRRRAAMEREARRANEARARKRAFRRAAREAEAIYRRYHGEEEEGAAGDQKGEANV